MFFDNNEERLFVASYDVIQSYIYVLDIQKQIIAEPEKNMSGKVVSMIPYGAKWNF